MSAGGTAIAQLDRWTDARQLIADATAGQNLSERYSKFAGRTWSTASKLTYSLHLAQEHGGKQNAIDAKPTTSININKLGD